jgi:hypothetical protein
MSATRCVPFWTEYPSILWSEANDFFPFHAGARKCTTTALNSLTRFGLYLGLLLAFLYRDFTYIGISVGLAVISIAAYYGMKSKGNIREGFENVIVAPTLISVNTPNLVGGIAAEGEPVADVIGTKNRTLPTGPNPFMNLLINEIKDNPTKPPAANVDTLARQFSNEIQTRVYSDPDDVFQHNQNQRIWVVQPNTSIPNDRESFQNWLYRVPGKTCKEGNNAACRTGTEGSAIPWLSAP